jgi:hypothetical protein
MNESDLLSVDCFSVSFNERFVKSTRFLSIVIILLLASVPISAQEQTSASDTLPTLKDEVERVLSEANLPFTEDQERAIILMMEDRRKASEDLFGILMDFSAGPTQGQEADRLNSAIEWMRNEFLTRLEGLLTPDQIAAWNRYRDIVGAGAGSSEDVRERSLESQQTQYVRINNNAWAAEELGYRLGGSGTEVIERGGVGAYHGNMQVLIKDQALNARNPFARNKPPYQERQFSFDLSGPVIPGRLTALLSGSQAEAQNVDTVHATTPEGIFELGIVKPNVDRALSTKGTYQFSEAHSLTFSFEYGRKVQKNQGIGGFTLPERAYNLRGSSWNMELRQFSSLSPQSIFETRFSMVSNHNEMLPITNAPLVNVLDSFNSGGSQNHVDNTGRTFELSNLYTRVGEKLTIKTGMQSVYRRNRSFSESNFGGTFTFSSMAGYLLGQATNYRVNRGNPLLETDQFEFSGFMQHDLKLTPQFTLMYGVRYDIQTNLRDRNNIAPRLSMAYGIGRSTVIRAGIGVFYPRLPLAVFENVSRLDGTRQFEVVVEGASYPDPFQGGTVRNSQQAVRVFDPTLRNATNYIANVSFERTFLTNLFFSISWQGESRRGRHRTLNLNAPLPGQRVRPDPSRGNILNLESTDLEVRPATVRMNLRQRFSIFVVTANYTVLRARSQASPGAYLDPPTNNYDPKLDWGRPSTPTHNFASSVNARLPYGIFLTGSLSVLSARYYEITTGRDDNGDTYVTDRPAGVVRNGGKGPAFFGLNMNISKAFFFGSAPANNVGTRTNANVFANVTNLLNHTNLGDPSGVVTSPNFGRSTSARDARQIQVGLRFQF